MSAAHNIDIYDCKEIWECIKEYHDVTVRRQKKGEEKQYDEG